MPADRDDPTPSAASGEVEESDRVLTLRADAVDWREVDGQVVVLDRAGSVYLAVNAAGAALWPAIVEGATRSQLVQVLLDTFDVERARAERDVDVFVASLAERGLLES
ncbi:MAG: PqqD family protein [Actinobacteria bacterium]|nr:PqqD family protein [Actinomycetota bacterium]